MSGAPDGWTTSPTGMSDLQGPNWGVSNSEKSATNFQQTLRPFDQTMSPFQSTKRPTEPVKESRHPAQQRPMKPIKKSRHPAQQRSSQPSSKESSQKPTRSSQPLERMGVRRSSRPIPHIDEPLTAPRRSTRPIPQIDEPLTAPRRSSRPSPQIDEPLTAPRRSSRPSSQIQEPLTAPRRSSRPISRNEEPLTAPRRSTRPILQIDEPLTAPRRSSRPSPQIDEPLTAPPQRSRRDHQRRSHRIPDDPNNFGHLLVPSRSPDQPQESRHHRHHRQSEHITKQHVLNFEQPSRPADSAKGAQPRRKSQLSDDRSSKSKPIPNHRSSSPVQPSQKISMGFPHLDRQTNKSTSSGSNSSSDTYIELAPARRRELISRVNESVQHVMASMLSDNSNNGVQWKPKLRKKDISYFMDETSVKPGQTRFCCVSHTHASVEDIMKLFVVSSDGNTVMRNNRILADSLLEARILSVLRRPTKERPMNSMYVRYSSYQAPGLMTDREIRVAVATDMIHQADGSTIGYCLWDSVDDPEFAEANKKPGVETCNMFRSGFFLRRSGRRFSSKDPNQAYTKIVYMVGFEPGGWAPGLTARLMMEKFGANLLRLCSHFRRKCLDSRTFVMKTDWEAKMSAKSCKECTKPFQMLSNRVNCHSCGHVVCKSCVSKEQVELHAVGVVPMNICYSCLDTAGLPVPASQKTRSSLGRRRLQSDSVTMSRVSTEVQAQPMSHSQPQQQSKSFVESDLIEEEDEDDDTDTGEWAFTPSGVPIRPYRKMK